ncbi:hypothetical protein [Arsenicibacter rosenii]|uniref:Uncharacterized protein n=1 Tax=Arsenicibacter rosenii TaxID=1750698 RepID=A0A1S2VPN9_9BACT|nr:hypothetical protein [Arsenicibacter rosenii]OIN60156.1 hypothetical protein BLX24_04755 [Arsenicibacter rosenii]
MNTDEKNEPAPNGAQINGRDKEPDNAGANAPSDDNKHQDVFENSANGLDTAEVRGGQDGRNIRGIGSTDMDSQNGLLRFNDTDDANSAVEVTEEAQHSIAADDPDTSKTASVDVTTHGPDDYASAEEVDTPEAEKEAKEHEKPENPYAESGKEDDDIARTGTSTEHKPTY